MTPKEKLYDAVMRLPIVVFTLYFFGRELAGMRDLVATHPYFGGDWPFLGALAVCKLIEQQSASLPVKKRLACFPAMASR